jgi:hypothetical protein
MYPLPDDIKRFALLDDMVSSLRAVSGQQSQSQSTELMPLNGGFSRLRLPPPPQAGIELFDYSDTGRNSLGVMSMDGIPLAFQPQLGDNFVYEVVAQDNSTSLYTRGMGVTTAGTVVAKTIEPSFDSYAARTRRVGLRSASTAGSAAGLVGNYASLFRGKNIGEGGFYVQMRFGIAAMTTTPSASRVWFGLSPSVTGPANFDFSSSSAVHSILYGAINGDGNLSLWHNDASGAPTKVDTGLPRPLANDVFDVKFFCKPGGTEIFSSVRNVSTGGYFVHRTADSTDIPGDRTRLSPVIGISNNAATQFVEIDFHQLYMEVPSL